MYQRKVGLVVEKKIEPLSLGELERYANDVLKIKNFRGVFVRQLLPNTPYHTECGIVNLGDADSDGTHWTCYIKIGDRNKFYFDSYGDARPPAELVRYLGGGDGLVYNDCRIQQFDDPPICGHLCLDVLRRYSKGGDDNWNDIVNHVRDDKYGWLSWWVQ